MAGYFLGRLPDPTWQVVLDYFLERTDTFQVHLPEGHGPLSFGRDAVERLPGAAIGPWSGMKDADEITGPATTDSAALFRRLEASLRNYESEKKLWDYQLLDGGEARLYVGDYTDLVIFPTETQLAELRDLGVPIEEPEQHVST